MCLYEICEHVDSLRGCSNFTEPINDIIESFAFYKILISSARIIELPLPRS